MTRVARIVVAGCIVALTAPPALAHRVPPTITPSSIARATLGLGAGNYERILGKPFRLDSLEGGISRITFPVRKTEVYLRGGRGFAIATWNREYETPQDLGPCSTVRELRSWYGGGLVPFRVAGKVVAYRAGALIFTAENGKTIGVVALGRTREAVFAALNAPECAGKAN